MSSIPAQQPDGKPHLYLIDASGFIFRAYYALPSLTRADGTPVGAVLGFTNMLIKLLREHAPTHMAVVFDVARHTFRNDLYAAYKANRAAPPEDLIPQFNLVREATDAFKLPRVELAGFEADDVMATLARQGAEAGWDVTIVSSDKDLMQLIAPKIRLWDPIKNIPLQDAAVLEKFGVTPDKVPDIQALAGDATDNVPGVPGIGVKTAAELINQYGNLENLLANAGNIKQPKRREVLINHAEDARISYKLVSLEQNCPLPCTLDDLLATHFDPNSITPFLQEMGFKTLLGRLGGNSENKPSFIAPRPTDSLPAHVQVTSAPEVARQPVSVIKQYRTITKADELQTWLDAALRDNILAVDTETTDLTPARADMVGISLAGSAADAVYIPLAHRSGNLLDPQAPENADLQSILAVLKPVLEDTGIVKIGHNIKYDWQIFARHGVHIAPYDDTMLISYLVDGSSHGHGMDDLARLHLDHQCITYDSLTGTGVARIGFDLVPVLAATDYAAEDAAVTLALWQVLKPRLKQERVTPLYEDIERPLIGVIANMEMTGITVDPAVLQGLSAGFATRLQAIEADIHAAAGHPFNIGSPKQLGQVLFGEMGLTGGKKTKTGEWSTSVDVLEELAEAGHEIVTKIMDWRQLSKLMSTYTETLPRQIVPRTGRVHTSYAMAHTNTGRLASSDPNLQNIPIRTEEGRSIRTAFIAPSGSKLISADYSQIELRLVAEMAGIARLQEAFRNNIDIHTATASEVFGLPLDAVPPERRREAKAINFGIIYGISAFGLSRQIGTSPQEASQFINAYFARFPELRAFMDAAKQEARDNGFVRTLLGRKCFIGGIHDKNPVRRQAAERQAINAPVQGTAADIIKLAMVDVERALRSKGLQTKLLLQVHDELVLEAPDNEVQAVIALLHDIMPHVIKLSLPLAIEAKAADNWSAAH